MPTEDDFNDPRWFRENETGKWTCLACDNEKYIGTSRMVRHEQSQEHQRCVQALLDQQARKAQDRISRKSQPPTTNISENTTQEEVDNAQLTAEMRSMESLSALLASAPDTSGEMHDYLRFEGVQHPAHIRDGEELLQEVDDLVEGWDEYTLDYNDNDAMPIELFGREKIQASIDKMLDFDSAVWDEDSSDEGSGEERSDAETEKNETDEEEDIQIEYETDLFQGRPSKRTRRNGYDYSKEWFPWEDKLSCTLDILMHLPRSVFSQKQLDLFLWILDSNGVKEVPTTRTMKTVNNILQKSCGIDSIRYKGSLGHTYYVNDIRQILAQEMANPKVRPHLKVYPSDTGGFVEEACEADAWLHEIDDEYLTPMARVKNQDYYIFEPCMTREGNIVMPHRWFTRPRQTPSGSEDHLYAKVWGMKQDVDQTDGSIGWSVMCYGDSEVDSDNLLLSFPVLASSYKDHLLPDPRIIHHFTESSQAGAPLRPWKKTNPIVGNRWREHAKGARVYSCPIWLYCDDTSGNSSKKWNKHNSFLFTAAGLPRRETQKEYNIHFLCTSNLAPPPEMLDGIVEQLEACMTDGAWAFDCEHGEQVLIIIPVLAVLGDNPMQSELACHAGLNAKFYCRVCGAKGTDAQEDKERGEQSPSTDSHTLPVAAMYEQNSGSESDASMTGSTTVKKRGKRALESMSQMLRRVKEFMKIGKPRRKEETLAALREVFTTASVVGGKTRAKNMKTESGCKDSFQEYFIKRMTDSYQNISGHYLQQQALDKCISTFPNNTLSPIWRLHEINPHSDTPVEILHVVLLGFVKYFWRDVVQNQLKGPGFQTKKDLLVQRLNSVDVSGLGIPPLAGHTLVQYAGSLTGRDFRAICQVAPYVLYDLVTPECFAAWIALSKLVPLIWQPKINDLKSHIALMEREIHHFLYVTAKWSPRWFNKPKFHILLHLPEHVRRFGPAILFATEAFESYNAVIRAKSIHSNRHAPSRDIALQFAQCNRVRHALSGGRIPLRAGDEDSTSALAADVDLSNIPKAQYSSSRMQDVVDAAEAGLWRRVGKGPQNIAKKDRIVRSYLGLQNTGKRQPGETVNVTGSEIQYAGDTLLKFCGMSANQFSGHTVEIVITHIVVAHRCHNA